VLGYKPFGTGQPLDVQVHVTDSAGVPVTTATVNVTASNGLQSWSGTLAAVGGNPGFYRVCNVGAFSGGATSITINASVTAPGFNNGSGTGIGQNGNLGGCP
jgi:hypothetical protein